MMSTLIIIIQISLLKMLTYLKIIFLIQIQRVLKVDIKSKNIDIKIEIIILQYFIII